MSKKEPKTARKNRSGAGPPLEVLSSRARWLLLVVAIATLAAFEPAVHNGFTKWDDPVYVTGNYQIRDLTPGTLREDFTTFFAGNYHPLTLISLALDYHSWRLNPQGYHIANVALHLLNTLVVFGFILLLTGSSDLAAITSLFFGIHPLHVESVAWVSARKDLLYVLFYLAASASYVLWIRGARPRAGYYAAALGLFVLSLLSKGMAVTLPVALLLIDFYVGRTASLRRLLVEKAPFFLLSLVFGLVAIAAQKSAGFIGDVSRLSFLERALVACYGFLAYLFKGLAPVKLSAFYPYPDSSTGILPPIFWLAPILIVVLALMVRGSLRYGRGILFGALFYSANVALILQWLPVGGAIVADRYTYLSYVGVGLALAVCFTRVLPHPIAREGRIQRYGAVLLAVLSLSMILATRARCEVWSDNVTLWSDVIRKYPTVGLAYVNRAKTYKDQGEYERASADLERALALRPEDPGALCSRGNLFYLRGERVRALADLDRAVHLDARMADAWNSRGAVRSSLGRYEEALSDFHRAIELQRRFPDAYLNRANALLALRQYERALADYGAYIAWEPADARGYFCRGLARSRRGDAAGASEDYGTAIRLEPNFAHAYFFRSRAFVDLRQYEGALRDARTAQGLGYPVEESYIDSLKTRAP